MHSLMVPANLLSLCFTIGLLVPTIAASAVPRPSTSLASPLYRRSGDDPGNVQPQVDDLFRYLSTQDGSNVEARKKDKLKTYVAGVNKALEKAKMKNLKVLFVQYAGSGGDVGKSVTYTEAIKSRSIHRKDAHTFQKMLRFFHLQRKDKDPHIEMKFTVDCNYLKYMTEAARKDWESDIKECLVGEDKESEEANQQKFKEVFKETLKDYKPHVIIQGNPIPKLYKEDKTFWESFHTEMNDIVENDEVLRINIRADFKLKEEVDKKLGQYPMKMNDVVLVGQPVDFFQGLPTKTRQTRVGRPVIQNTKENPDDLLKWMDKQKNIMYVGIGGPQREVELKIGDPLKALDQFVTERLEDGEDDDWSFIMFHNVRQPEGEEEKNPITDGGRVYHLWWGINTLKLMKHKNMRIAMHHCGRGILDDTIEAELVPICVGTSDFGGDQFQFAQQLEQRKMGRGLKTREEGIYFENAKSDREFKGVQKDFCPDVLGEMFKDVKAKLEDMKKELAQFKPGVLADTSGQLTFEIMYGLKYHQFKRKPPVPGP